MTRFIRLSYALALFVMLGAMLTPASAQITCNASVGVPPILRSDGLAEPVADVVLTCTAGALTPPTPPGLLVPQINITIFLNTIATGKITAVSGGGENFSEALLLVDEPNTPTNFMYPNGRPLLNCGQTGAPDSGISGPGVCEIVSNGVASQTYDGTQNTYSVNTCDGLLGRPAMNSFSCGRPNAFQGQILAGGENNAIVFLGVPFDPPAPLATRTIRITNLRANANLLGPPVPPTVPQVMAAIAISGSTAITITNPIQPVGFIQRGLVPGGCGTPPASTVRLCEGFSSAWKTKNLSFFVGDNIATPGNAIPFGGFYTYAGTSHYPADIAQNVPGAFYMVGFTESHFEWENAAPNGPPSPNPPLNFGTGSVPNLGFPLFSMGYGGTNTMPNLDGAATAGTRFALQFSGVPGGASIQVPLTVNLYHPGCGPCTPTGVMELTNADAAGGGPFSAAASITLGASNMAVYELLYADPFSIQYADVPYTVVGGSAAGIVVSQEFAPFYSDPASRQPSQTGFLPRFAALSGGASNLMGIITGMNLPHGTTTSLNAKLNTVLADIAANDLAGACSALASLISEASAQSGKKLTVAQANTIISMAMQLEGQLGC